MRRLLLILSLIPLQWSCQDRRTPAGGLPNRSATIASPAKAQWHFDGFTEIRAYRTNWHDKYAFERIRHSSGGLNPTRTPSIGVLLTPAQEEKLKAAVTVKHPDHPVAMCMLPHHAFVFFDASGGIVGSIDLCFICSNYRGSPTGFSSSWDLAALRSLLLELGIPIRNPAWD